MGIRELKARYRAILSESIKRLRKDKGWTQERLSREASLSLATIQKMENGKTGGDDDSIDKLAAAFGMPREKMFGEAPNGAGFVREEGTGYEAAQVCVDQAGWLEARGSAKTPKPPKIKDVPATFPSDFFRGLVGPGLEGDDVFLLHVVGHAHEPGIRHGGIVLCSRKEMAGAPPLAIDGKTGGYRLLSDGYVPEGVELVGCYLISLPWR